MTNYIDYGSMSPNDLKKFASKYGLDSRGTKEILVERLIEFDLALEEKYNDLFEKYVPPTGKIYSSEGNLLAVVSRLIYRYYNDGDSFSQTMKEYEDIHDLTSEDKRFVDSYVNKAPPAIGISNKDSIIVFKFLYDTVKRVEQRIRKIKANNK